jgi:hypothetical protein
MAEERAGEEEQARLASEGLGFQMASGVCFVGGPGWPAECLKKYKNTKNMFLTKTCESVKHYHISGLHLCNMIMFHTFPFVWKFTVFVVRLKTNNKNMVFHKNRKSVKHYHITGVKA